MDIQLHKKAIIITTYTSILLAINHQSDFGFIASEIHCHNIFLCVICQRLVLIQILQITVISVLILMV